MTCSSAHLVFRKAVKMEGAQKEMRIDPAESSLRDFQPRCCSSSHADTDCMRNSPERESAREKQTIQW